MQREHLSGEEELLRADTRANPEPASDHGALGALLERPATLSRAAAPEVSVGDLVALADDGFTALVRFAGQPGTAAVRARTVLDLHGAHIGQQVVLAFEGGDVSRPIVMGVLRRPGDRPLQAPEDAAGQVQVEADGQRLLVNARQELVLQCGKASITLTRAGKVLIQGSYVSSRSTGVNRIKGGSVQLN